MTGTLERTDTGTFAAVRVVEPGDPVSAPYSRAELTAVDQYRDAQINRAMLSVKRRLYRAYDEAIAEALNGARLPKRWPTVDDLIARRQRPEQTAEWFVQSGSVEWAELPPEPPPAPTVTVGGWTPPRRPSDVLAEMYDERTTPVAAEFPGALPVLAGPAPDENMPGRYALTPRSQVQAGPRSRLGRWVDEQLQRPGRWWRARKAATEKRMGITDGERD